MKCDWPTTNYAVLSNHPCISSTHACHLPSLTTSQCLRLHFIGWLLITRHSIGLGMKMGWVYPYLFEFVFMGEANVQSLLSTGRDLAEIEVSIQNEPE